MTKTLQCNFCGKTNDAVTLLFRSDDGRTLICDECVELAMIYQNKYMRQRLRLIDIDPKIDPKQVKKHINDLPMPDVLKEGELE